KDALLALAQKSNGVLSFLYPCGSYLLEGSPVMLIDVSGGEVPNELQEKILAHLSINSEETIDHNFYYGFRQLTEVAVKALSPGINDPGTAVQSMRALASLLAYRLLHFPDNVMKDQDGTVRIITKEASFEDLFQSCLLPVWDYGKEDRFIQKEMQHLLLQLQAQRNHPAIRNLLAMVEKKMGEKRPGST
ncbi:MAG TPA: DUF2254 family protein, partial [Flavisolibacter sp.]|nr:DUF2254 family protein [Flavisolibacter sp.]